MPSPSNATSEGSSAAGTTKAPAPSLIGVLFVRKFYTMLSTCPDQLYRFYKEDSVFSYGTEGETTESFAGDQEINKKILSLDYKNTNVLIASLEAQQSLKGGMIVLVSGSFNTEATSRQFTETFFLATQPAGFYVLNDIRLLKAASTVSASTENGGEQASSVDSEAQSTPTESTEAPEAPKEVAASEPVVEAPATPEPAPAPVEAPATPTPTPAPVPAVATPSPSTVPPTPASTPVTPAPAPATPSPATPTTSQTSRPQTQAPPAVVDSKPKSFLSAVQSGGSSAASTSASHASTNVAQASKLNPKAAKTTTTTARKPTTQSHDPDAASVFVRNLPHAVDQQVKELEVKLRELFSHQGTVKNINTGFLQRGYCFVEFESPETAQRCIKAAEGGNLQIDGKALMVEEKKATGAVTKSDSGSKVGGSSLGSRTGGAKPNPRTGDRTTAGTSSARRGGSSVESGTRRPPKPEGAGSAGPRSNTNKQHPATHTS